MKTMMTTLAALALTASAASAQQPVPMFYGCETVDQGGYLTFADPTCPAAVTSTQADYITVSVEVAPGVFEDREIATSNK